MASLSGTVAVITGAGRGIGREHALAFAAEGAQVVVNDLGSAPDGSGGERSPADDVVAEIHASGGSAVANHDDVSDPAGATRIVECAVDSFGGLHSVVNNAGILRDRVLVNMDEADWDIVLRVNLRGTYLVSRAAASYWRRLSKEGGAPAGAIVNTSSESGAFGNAGQANYAAAKSGIATLTQVAAKELERYGVRVNAIAPRARTRLTVGSFGEGFMGAQEGSFDKWDPANVSPFVVYLASPLCQFTGELFLVGGSVVQRIKPWELDPAWKLRGDGRWTLDALDEAVREAGDPAAAKRDTGLVR